MLASYQILSARGGVLSLAVKSVAHLICSGYYASVYSNFYSILSEIYFKENTYFLKIQLFHDFRSLGNYGDFPPICGFEDLPRSVRTA